ncbi:hypothetical protein LXA43DRAFT_1020772 [Ganoderma leucocontextum]|nr:hypothetical protein LXA43DRAFT_1020772 [Ganoderma leucocontextum]
MKFVTQEQQDAQQRATIIGGLKGLAGGLVASVLPAYYFQRKSTYYRNLQPSLKALGIILVAIPACVISAEKAGIAYEREQWDDVGKLELDAQQRRQEASWDNLTLRHKLSDFVRRHEYGVIVGSWAVALTGALRYALKDPIQSTTQKVVQARVWAQGLTIGIIIAAGILTHAQRSRVYEEEDERGVRRLPTDHSWMDVLRKREKEKEGAKSGALTARGA